MSRVGYVVALALLGASVGCHIEEPVALEQDPEWRERYKLPLEDSAAWTAGTAPLVAVAPVARSYDRPRDAAFVPESAGKTGASGTSPVDTTTEAALTRTQAEATYPYSWFAPPLDERRLQDRLGALVKWGLYKNGRDVPIIEPGRLPPIDQSKLAADAEDPSRPLRVERERALCEAADDLRAELLVHVDVIQDRVSWVERDFLPWSLNLLLFWGGGLLPIVFVPDEEYEVSLTARVTVVHARTGARILQKEFTGSERRALNDAQRGWSLPGFFGLEPYTVSDSGFQTAYENLLPHAEKSLEAEILAGLRRSLPEAVGRQEIRTLLADGREGRTYAVVVGHDGPAKQRLQGAENDANDFQQALLDTRTVEKKDHLRFLRGTEATRQSVLQAVADLAPRILGNDRLIFYYAGFGTTDADDRPQLLLGGGADALSLAELGDACRGLRRPDGHSPTVIFLLDTSFRGGSVATGRTFPGSHSGPATREPLEALSSRGLPWCVLAAAEPSTETAFERDGATAATRHGFFTTRLLKALAGEAKTTVHAGRPAITTNALIDYLVESVPEDVMGARQAKQTPVRRGTLEAIPVAFQRPR